MKRRNLYIFIIIMIVGISLVMSEYFITKKDKIYNDFNSNLLLLSSIPEVKEDVGEPEVEQQPVEPVKTSINPVQNYYIGSLSIPKLNFNRGFVDPSSKDNTISKNLEIINSSTMPTEARHNLIIAGHSGTGPIAFFKDLHKLNKGDELIINYQGLKYHYNIEKIYLQDRTGRIGVFKDPARSGLTLITCTFNDKAHQTVYIAYLTNVQRI